MQPQSITTSTPADLHDLLSDLGAMIPGWDLSRPTSELSSALKERLSTQTTTQTGKRRGKSMSRRKGQLGRIEKHGKHYTLRVWVDVKGQEERAHVRIKICPINKNSPGWLNSLERQNEAKRIIGEIGANSRERFNEVVHQTQPGERTFREQSEIYVQTLRNRLEVRKQAGPDSAGQSTAAASRRSGAASTLELTECCLRSWLLPMLGDLPLSKVNNGALKRLVDWMAMGGPMPSNGKKGKA